MPLRIFRVRHEATHQRSDVLDAPFQTRIRVLIWMSPRRGIPIGRTLDRERPILSYPCSLVYFASGIVFNKQRTYIAIQQVGDFEVDCEVVETDSKIQEQNSAMPSNYPSTTQDAVR